jgi:MFS family permease
MPVVLTILGDIFTLEERARIQGFFSAVWGTSSLAGPALGALLVNTLGWRWVFLVNLPFGAIALLVLMWKYHDVEKPHSTDLNLTGVSALAVGCTALLALVSRIGPDGWSWPVAVLLCATSAAAIGFFIFHERVAASPIFTPSLIFNRAVGPSILATLFFGAGFLCLDTYVPLYVQAGRGGGATAAAGVVTPVLLTWALSGVVVAPLLVRWGFRRMATVGSILIVLGFLGLFLSAYYTAPKTVMTIVLLLTGVGFSATSMTYLLSAQDAAAWQQRGLVTASIGFVRSIGGALGVGLLGALFNSLVAPEMARFRSMGIAPASLLDPHTYNSLAADVRAELQHAISHGLLWVFAAMVAMSLAQLVVTRLLRRKKCDHAVSAAEAVESLAG